MLGAVRLAPGLHVLHCLQDELYGVVDLGKVGSIRLQDSTVHRESCGDVIKPHGEFNTALAHWISKSSHSRGDLSLPAGFCEQNLLSTKVGENVGQLVLVNSITTTLTKIQHRNLRNNRDGCSGSGRPDSKHPVDRVEREDGELLSIRLGERVGLLRLLQHSCQVHCLEHPEGGRHLLWVGHWTLSNLSRLSTRRKLTNLSRLRSRRKLTKRRNLTWVVLATSTYPITIASIIRVNPGWSPNHVVEVEI